MRNTFIPGRSPGAEGVPAQQGYRSVDPEVQLEKLREEKDELERELEVLRAEQKAHKCPPRFSNPFKRAPKPERSWRDRDFLENSGLFSSVRGKLIPIMFGVAAIGMVVCFVFLIVNSMVNGIQSGIITNLHHQSAYFTTTTTTDSNHRSHTTTTFHPARWWAIVCDEGRCNDADMSESRWETMHEGQRLCLRDCNSTASR